MGEITTLESPGKEVEVVWTCDGKTGALRRKEGDGNESTREKEVEGLREDGWTSKE